jgi:hypothetical protein
MRKALRRRTRWIGAGNDRLMMQYRCRAATIKKPA